MKWSIVRSGQRTDPIDHGPAGVLPEQELAKQLEPLECRPSPISWSLERSDDSDKHLYVRKKRLRSMDIELLYIVFVRNTKKPTVESFHVTCYPFICLCELTLSRSLSPRGRGRPVLGSYFQDWGGCLCASLTRRDPPRPGGNRKEVRRTTWFRKHTTSSQRVGLATWAWSGSGSFVLHRVYRCNATNPVLNLNIYAWPLKCFATDWLVRFSQIQTRPGIIPVH